jgi:pseudaminic acid biosynthesis-associated methylase
MTDRENDPLEAWRGEFGREYTDRNIGDVDVRRSAFANLLEGLQIESVLEVGCNRGHNLVALTELLGEQVNVVGIEPNEYALRVARRSDDRIGVLRGDAVALPFATDAFDLVFTSGVLIHIPPTDLSRAMAEIHRVSRRFILCIEYFAEKDTELVYRGQTGLLWKRDFGGRYEELFPSLTLERTGFLDREAGFDSCNWWLFRKEG